MHTGSAGDMSSSVRASHWLGEAGLETMNNSPAEPMFSGRAQINSLDVCLM